MENFKNEVKKHYKVYKVLINFIFLFECNNEFMYIKFFKLYYSGYHI